MQPAVEQHAAPLLADACQVWSDNGCGKQNASGWLLYYASVAVLIDPGKVTKWVRRRDLRKGYYGKEKCVEPFRNPNWQMKLKCTCLWVPAPDADAATARPRPIDPHSSLPLELQLEVLRRTRAAGVDSMPMPD